MRAFLLIAIAAIAATTTACSVPDPSLGSRLVQTFSPPRDSSYAVTGTAFFISEDGFLLTAEHVVHQCLQINILSGAVAPTTASLVATDDDNDLAILRTDTRAPAVLAVAEKPPHAAEAVRVYGYPANADLRHASVTEAKLANDRVRASVNSIIADPRFILWLDGHVERGYSGGPVIDSEGNVLGVMSMKVLKLRDQTPTEYRPLLGLGAAIGTKEISSLTAKIEFKRPAAAAKRMAGGRADSVLPAIVRVVCWLDHPPKLDVEN